MRTVQWQCISCNDEFANKSAEMPPIECPKCGGQAARLTYRTCPKCEREALVTRARLTEQGQAQRETARGQSDGEIPDMGATLPILCKFYVSKLSHLGTHAGRLYGLNTLGAALGALLCGFWLINLLGVLGTLIFAVAVNGIIEHM